MIDRLDYVSIKPSCLVRSASPYGFSDSPVALEARRGGAPHESDGAGRQSTDQQTVKRRRRRTD